MANSRSDLDRLLLSMLRIAAFGSTIAAAVGLALALVDRWHGGSTRLRLAGCLILAGNAAAYRYRERLYARQVRNGIAAVLMSLAAGVLLFVADAPETPYFEGLLVGVGLAAIAGQVGWSMAAAGALTGLYVSNLALRGYPVGTRVVFGNVAGTFMIAGALSSMQWWFARFVNTTPNDEDDPAPIRDAYLITARDENPALNAGAQRPRRLALMPGAPDGSISTMSAAERVERLSDLQLQIFRLQSDGLRKGQIARRLHISPSTLYRERQEALRLACARTDEQLVGMIVHYDTQAV